MVAANYPGAAYPGEGYAAPTGIGAPFIAAATTVYAPTLAGTGTATLTAPHIAATTSVYTPTVDFTIYQLAAPYIAATTSVYTPTLSPSGTATITAPHIAATSTLYAASVRKSGIGPQPLGISIAFNDTVLENAPTWFRLDA